MCVMMAVVVGLVAAVLVLVVQEALTGNAASVTGGPNPNAPDLPLFQAYSHALPDDLLDLLMHDALVHTELAKKGNNFKFGKLPTTWYPLTGEEYTPPRFAAEVAISYLRHLDFPGDLFQQHNVIGAEWWFQVREDDETIGFHYDKDEAVASNEMRLSHPVMSTVTYLTDTGGPTLVFNQTSVDGNLNEPIVAERGALSFPSRNKHISFHGNLMHGVVGSLAKPPMNTASADSRRRVTFLVNWWAVKAQPPNCQPLPVEHVRLFEEKTRGALALLDQKPFHDAKPEPFVEVTSPNDPATLKNSDFFTISLPPDERVHVWWDKKREPGTYNVTWTSNAILGGAGVLDLFQGTSVRRVFESAAPKLFLFYDETEHDLFELEKPFLRAVRPHLHDFVVFTAEKSVTADAMKELGIPADHLPTAAIHDTRSDKKFVLTGLFSRRGLETFIQDFKQGRLQKGD